MKKIDILIIGAGAAGLMCAIEAGKRNRRVVVIDHANRAGKKIIMSGGGRCNFTNYHIKPENYLSHNPHFCKSALSRYTQWDFIDLVKRYRIPFHEKKLGQLFCDEKSQDIVNMLLTECEKAGVTIQLNTSVKKIEKLADYSFQIESDHGSYLCESVVIASGGLSIPTMGASPFAYKIAEQFGLHVYPTRAGLVPLTLHKEDKELFSVLSGISVDSDVSNDQINFRENILFTHRGLSGPAILQISSYWQPGEAITVNLLPEINLYDALKEAQSEHPKKQLSTILMDYLPKRLIELVLDSSLADKNLASLSNKTFEQIADQFNAWQIKPNGSEGYRTAEVTLGGVDCDMLSSKTMEVKNVPGLYFIGEAVDVTGWLGGYNFQWAWASGFAAGQVA